MNNLILSTKSFDDLESDLANALIERLQVYSLTVKSKEATQVSNHSQKFGNAKDTAKRYGVHPNTIRNWAKQGFIKKRMVEGVSLYSFEEIDIFIDSKAV